MWISLKAKAMKKKKAQWLLLTLTASQNLSEQLRSRDQFVCTVQKQPIRDRSFIYSFVSVFTLVRKAFLFLSRLLLRVKLNTIFVPCNLYQMQVFGGGAGYLVSTEIFKTKIFFLCVPTSMYLIMKMEAAAVILS